MENEFQEIILRHFPNKKPRNSILFAIDEICKSLDMAGERITIRRVREILGKGSYSTIGKYLRFRKSAMAFMARECYAGTPMPEFLKERFRLQREVAQSDEFCLSSKEAEKLFFSEENKGF